MDDTLTQVLLVCAAFAVIFGPLTARSSHRKNPVQGGILAHAFHLIGSMAFVSTLPGVITALILGGGIRLAFPLALGLTALSLSSLMVYALFERQEL
jgi:FtsH-binding integral membrane protein